MGKVETTYNGEEHRNSIRFSIDQMVEISFGRENLVQARGVDISAGGASCKTTLPVDIGARLALKFALPLKSGTKEIECEGEVVRCQRDQYEYRVALSFSKLAAADKKFIEKFAGGAT